MTKTSRSSNSTEPRRADPQPASPVFERWFDKTWSLALEDLSFSELRRSLQALSRRYVQKRDSIDDGGALEGAGKRAAFAAFYAPLHLQLIAAVVRELGWVAEAAPHRIVDLGCGTGASSAGWIEAILTADGVAASGDLASGNPRLPAIEGVDRSAWALGQARETWKAFGARGRAHRGSMETIRPGGGAGRAILAAWAINELPADSCRETLGFLRRAADAGSRVLVVEPISKRTTPWWPEWSDAAQADGGQVGEWQLQPQLPALWWELDRAARLDHRRVKLKTLCWRPLRPLAPT